MKGSTWFSIIFIAFLLCAGHAHHRKVAATSAKDNRVAAVGVKEKFYWLEEQAAMGTKGVERVEVAGSSLPDCSHACGSCSPCRLVMINFVCASLQEAETCPMAYRCMCNNKSYPLP